MLLAWPARKIASRVRKKDVEQERNTGPVYGSIQEREQYVCIQHKLEVATGSDVVDLSVLSLTWGFKS